MKSKLMYIIIFLIICVIQLSRVVNLNDVFKGRGTHYNMDIDRIFENNNSNIEKINLKKVYLVIKDSNNIKGDVETLENLKDVFDFSKINYEIKDISDPTLDLNSYTNIIIVKSEYFDVDINFFNEVVEKVNNGAKLFFLNGYDLNNPFLKFAGAEKSIDNRNGSGIRIKEEFYPGMKELKISRIYHNYWYSRVKLENNAKVFVTADNGDPLLWEIQRGKGRVLFSNSNLFTNINMQGFMKQFISNGVDIFISVSLNSKLFHIDDYPFPTPEGNEPVIYSEYGVDTPRFFKDIWWNDMKKIAEDNKIVYTAFMTTNYGLDSTEFELKNKIYIKYEDLNIQGRNLLKSGVEIGIHGFNHNSLSLSGGLNYENPEEGKPWDSILTMNIANKNFIEVGEKIYGKGFKFYSYVAPNNRLTNDGKLSLLNSFPDLKSLSGVFIKDENDKGLLTQKIGRDKDFPMFYTLPRFSFGYLKDMNTMWNIFNGVAAYGYVSHFNHPDDVISPDRNFNSSWSRLKNEFEEIVKSVNNNYPELTPRTQLDLALEYSKIENLYLETKLDENEINLKTYNFKGEYTAELRLRGKKILSVEGGEYILKAKYNGNNLYNLKIKDPNVKIRIGDE